MVTSARLNPHYPIEKLAEAGITLAHCTDNNSDLVRPTGNVDQLECAMIMTYKRQWSGHDNLRWKLWKYNNMTELFGRMITHEAADVVGYNCYGIEEGSKADLIVFDEPSIHWAIHNQSERKYVIKNGNVVVRNGDSVPEYKVSDYR